MKIINKNESGMTLVELIGAIVILSIISGLTFPILINGIKTSNNIQQETMFRDEADYLMAALLKELYVTKESEIIEIHFPDKTKPKDYYIKKKNGDRTGFINNKLEISNNIINTQNSSIKLSTLSPSKIEFVKPDEKTGEYEITLILELKGKKTMTFKNTIRTINDKE